jgi:hypothetical protein
MGSGEITHRHGGISSGAANFPHVIWMASLRVLLVEAVRHVRTAVRHLSIPDGIVGCRVALRSARAQQLIGLVVHVGVHPAVELLGHDSTARIK